MDDRRFDSLAKSFAWRVSRRGALFGGLVAGLVAVAGSRGGHGAAQNDGTPAASPAASPGATPGLLDLLAGTPAVTGGLARSGEPCCRALRCFDFTSQSTTWVRRREESENCYTEEEISYLTGQCNSADCDYTCRLTCIG